MFEKALTAAEARGNATRLRIAKWAVARCLRSLGRTTRRCAGRSRCAMRRTWAAPSDGYVFEEIAENLVALNRGDEARVSFAQAYRC
jgi:hypothetical protein